MSKDPLTFRLQTWLMLTMMMGAAAWPLQAANNWYAAPNGSSSGNATISNPVDLQTALNGFGGLQPGDTIWLRGGKYGTGGTMTFTSWLSGTAAAPIIVRQYPGERATIDGGLSILGSYVWYWGFEVENDNWDRINDTTGAPNGIAFSSTDQAAIGNKIINCVIHDTLDGIADQHGSAGSEDYGNLLYNIGFGQLGARGAGHNIYDQNSSTLLKYVSDNISYNAMDIGMQFYGHSGTVSHFRIDSNIAFNAGAPVGHRVDNVIVNSDDGGVPKADIAISNQIAYNPLDATSDNTGYNILGDGLANQDITVTNGWWVGATPTGYWTLQTSGWQTFTFTGNNVVGPMLTNGIGTYNFGNNVYYNSAPPSGVDPNSPIHNNNPTGLNVFVYPNKYETGRANIAVLNWNKTPSVSVNISGAGLSSGQSFSVQDAQNFWGAPVYSGTYNPGSPVISLPMNLTTVTPFIGNLGAATTPPHTSAEFGAFVLLPTNGATSSAPILTSPASATANVGTAFSYQISATNTPTSYNATGLPAGLSVNTSNGLISGTPTATGTSIINLSAVNGAGTGTATLTLTVANPPASVTINAASPAAASGVPGGSVSLTYSFTGGPTAINETIFVHFVDATGAIAFQDGPFAPTTPTTAWSTSYTQTRNVAIPASALGAYSIRAGLYDTATNNRLTLTPGSGVTADGTLRYIIGGLTVGASAPAPVVNSATSASATVGSAFSYLITATNSPTSFNATGLPAGLSVNTSNGLISGTPTASGTFTVTLSATNTGGTGTATLTLTVTNAPITVTINPASPAAASGVPGGSVSLTYSFTGGPTAINETIFVHFVDATGAIAFQDGPFAPTTPTTAWSTSYTQTRNVAIPASALGAYSIRAGLYDTATNNRLTLTPGSGVTADGTLRYIIGGLTVGASAPAPVVNSATSASATVGSAFSYLITATNSPTSFNATGLPAGLSVNTSNGLISGTPTASGTFTVTLSATNTGGTGTATLTLTVNALTTPQLIGAYGFNEGSGFTTADYSGVSSAGTITGATWTNGKYGQALNYNGAANTLMHIGQVPASLTLEAWIYPTGGGVVISELGQGTVNSSWHDSEMEVLPTGEIRIGFWTGAAQSISLGVVPLNSWHHVALTYDKPSQSVKGYVDGTLKNSGTLLKLWPSALWYGIGAADATNFGSGAGFSGIIDEVRIYTQALSQAQIQTDMATPIGGAPSAPTITSATSASATLGAAFTYSIIATNNPTSFNATGLPAGLSINTSNGLISGTPTASGTFTVTLSATNTGGMGTANLALTVNTVTASGTPFVTAVTSLGTLRNNHAGWVGMEVQVGASPLTVNALGRIYVSGNTQPHQVKFVVATTGLDMSGGAVTFTPTGTPNQLSYAPLASPITLAANTLYYLVSHETSGGDTWYDAPGTALSTTSDGTIPGIVWSADATPTAWNPINMPLHSYAPVGFQYQPPVSTGGGAAGYWSFDTAFISGNQALDQSGNNLTGLLANTTPTTGVNQALMFNGANAGMSVNSSPKLDLQTDLTIAAWLKTSNQTRKENFVGKYDGAGRGTGYLLSVTNAGTVTLDVGGNNLVSGLGSVTDTTPINDGRWHHVAVVMKLGQSVQFYIDGHLSSSQPTVLMGASNTVYFFAGMPTSPYFGSPYTGSMDELRVYDSALDAPTVLQLAMSVTPSIVTTTVVIPQITDNIHNARVYPNPWRNDKHHGMLIRFDCLPTNSVVKIFTLNGREIAALDGSSGETSWDPNNNVASGIYLYLIAANDSNGVQQKLTGKFVVIK